MGPDEDAGESSGDALEDGSGYDPYETFPDEGKNVIYHSFDFQNPDMVSAGTILNLPETDDAGNVLYAVEPDCLGSTTSTDADGNTVYECIDNPNAGFRCSDRRSTIGFNSCALSSLFSRSASNGNHD